MNQTIIESYQTLSRDQITNVTQNPIVIAVFIFIWFLITLIYLVIAGNINIKKNNGKNVKMISRINAWISVFVGTIGYAGLVLILLIFPVWIK